MFCFLRHKDNHEDDLNMPCCLCLWYQRFNDSGEEKPLLVSRDSAASISELFSLYNVEEGSTVTDGKSKKRKRKGKEKEIKIIWANNPDTNAIFTRLGAEDIVNRYDKLLNEWKMLKDAEREFKLMMGLEQEKDLVKCLGSIPPDMRIGFSHGASETDSDYNFHLDLDPLVSLDKLHESLNTRLRNAMQLFNTISNQLNIIKTQGVLIQKDLEKIVSCFAEDKDTSFDIKGVQHHVQLLNIQQVKQALLIVKDMVTLTTNRSFGMMNYIMQQGDNVDMQVLKTPKDSTNPKVIIYHKKFGVRKQRNSR